MSFPFFQNCCVVSTNPSNTHSNQVLLEHEELRRDLHRLCLIIASGSACGAMTGAVGKGTSEAQHSAGDSALLEKVHGKVSGLNGLEPGKPKQEAPGCTAGVDGARGCGRSHGGSSSHVSSSRVNEVPGEFCMEAGAEPVTRERTAASVRVANAVCVALRDAIADAVHVEMAETWAQGAAGLSPIAWATEEAGGAAGVGERLELARPSLLRLEDSDDDPACRVWGNGEDAGESSIVEGCFNDCVERGHVLLPDAIGTARHRPDYVRPTYYGENQRPRLERQASLAALPAGKQQSGGLGPALESVERSGNKGSEGREVFASAELVCVAVYSQPQLIQPSLPTQPVDIEASPAGSLAAAPSLRNAGAEPGDGRLGETSQ
jgi:hypothetical protein